MGLHFGTLFWPGTTISASTRYPALKGLVNARAVIIGGGMSGAACGYMLARSGIDAVLIEQRSIASGSSAANTGLLQYSNDTMLSEFAERMDVRQAVKFYRACKQAAEKLCVIAGNLQRATDFKRRNSLYYASSQEDVPALQREYAMLRQYGFDAEWWDESRIAEHFPFRRAAAIVTRGDGEVNPYSFVQALAEDACRNGLGIYENTAMLSVEPRSGGYRVMTEDGAIDAEHVIYAVGYAPELAGGRWLQPIMNRSFAIVTDPVQSLSAWHERFLMWETARPYLYARTTVDNRIVVGGLDENVRQPVLSERELRNRSMRLLSELHKLFPGLDARIRYEWCATFGESADGLPWLGEDPDRPGQYYCLGYGGNGSIYSLLGAEIIRDRLLGLDNPIASIVRPDRPTKVSP
ncbi:NAD(P)/FAD-dependent oxidoreductase [Cohnella cholangitidis]|uniref:FAD-binding oxidoreductase n=1 Tax=Cohnella cholangitidis TaxID=2598458 RepID=A0A7G5BVU1_9BACL|nr:FAD-dependent oxidoreductase [Cohnella cholangitidis]QMV41075.1 FAD-binding oxidoreductase [Cohnella cholangitidis]